MPFNIQSGNTCRGDDMTTARCYQMPCETGYEMSCGDDPAECCPKCRVAAAKANKPAEEAAPAEA